MFFAQPWAVTLGRSRPDLVGEDLAGRWNAFESKGRSSVPSSADKAKAKTQAQRLVSVGGSKCFLQIGSFAFFRSDLLEFYWRDPEPDSQDVHELPRPEAEWRYYYEPALSLAAEVHSEPMAAERGLADVEVMIHPGVRELLQRGLWMDAKRFASERREAMTSDGYQPDGIRVRAGESWARPFESHRRR